MGERKGFMSESEFRAWLGNGTPEVTSVQQAMRILSEVELPFGEEDGESGLTPACPAHE